MNKRRLFPETIRATAATAEDDALPVLLDHLDAYVAGINAVREVNAVKTGKGAEVEILIQEAREARRFVQDELERRGWTLQSDARTWLPAGFRMR